MPETVQILRSIGALEEAVRNLAAIAIRMDDKALAERQAIYDRVDLLKNEIQALTSKVEHATIKITDMEPTVTRMERNFERREGIRSFGKVIWGAIVSIATLAIAAVTLAVNFWFNAHPVLPH